MDKYKILSASIVFLALSVLFGGMWIGNSLNNYNAGKRLIESNMNQSEKALITLDEASTFLGISAEEIQEIISSEQQHMDKYHSFTGKMFPYIKLNNNFYFNKDELNEWVQEKASRRTNFDYYPVL